MEFGRGIRDLNRFKEVVSVFLKNDFGFILKQINLHRDLTLKERLNRKSFEPKDYNPRQIRKTFEELGGGFVKLGQILSLRPDIIPEEYCTEFSKLQDTVPSFPADKAVSILESELNSPIEKVFKSFSKEPIAAASIAQVHEAVLVSGKKVIVKIQRPGIKEKIQEDLDILKYIAGLFERYHHLEFLDINAVIKEIERYSLDELDFRKEARNIDLFYKYNLREKDIIVSKVHLEYTTEKVLVMDFIEGKELKKISPPNKKVSERLVQSVMKQIFIDGFFHGDPHPGNIIVKNDKIAFIDFGITGHLSDELKTKLFSLFVAAVNKDSKKMAETILEINMRKGVSKERVIEDLSLNFREYYSKDLKEINFSKLYRKTFEFARKDNILLPIDFVLFGKTIITLESVASRYDPSFNLVKSAKPFIRKNLAKELSPTSVINNLSSNLSDFGDFVKAVPKGSKKLMYRLESTDEDLKKIDKDVKTLTVEMDKSSNRVTYGIILASLLIVSALLINEKILTIFDFSLLSFIGFLASGVMIILIIASVLKEKRINKGDKND